MTSAFLDSPAVNQFDKAADQAFEPLRKNSLANRLFYGASEAANHSILWHALTWAPVLFGKRDPRQAAKISLALGIESAVINGPVKMLFRRERPVVTEERPHDLRIPLTSSFPSGHATSGFCAAILLGKHRYFPVAAIVASSRVHVKIHHASDVIAGAGIGLIFGKILKRILKI